MHFVHPRVVKPLLQPLGTGPDALMIRDGISVTSCFARLQPELRDAFSQHDHQVILLPPGASAPQMLFGVVFVRCPSAVRTVPNPLVGGAPTAPDDTARYPDNHKEAVT